MSTGVAWLQSATYGTLTENTRACKTRHLISVEIHQISVTETWYQGVIERHRPRCTFLGTTVSPRESRDASTCVRKTPKHNPALLYTFFFDLALSVSWNSSRTLGYGKSWTVCENLSLARRRDTVRSAVAICDLLLDTGTSFGHLQASSWSLCAYHADLYGNTVRHLPVQLLYGSDLLGNFWVLHDIWHSYALVLAIATRVERFSKQQLHP